MPEKTKKCRANVGKKQVKKGSKNGLLGTTKCPKFRGKIQSNSQIKENLRQSSKIQVKIPSLIGSRAWCCHKCPKRRPV